MILQFAPFELDTDRAELCGLAGQIALEPKAFALLSLLVENHDRVVTKDEMIATVWGGRFISDAAVSTALKLVRKALGDDGEAQSYIRTVRGRGHRFVAPVRIRVAAQVTAAPEPAAEASPVADGRPTIAVLPFGRMDLPDRFSTLGDAIPAEIISSLARLRWLRVIARESSFRFRGDTVDFTGLRTVLGAGFCLSGRVELVAGRLAVSVDLVDTRNGSLIWSDHFERAIDDLHAIRAEIVAAVIGALDLQIPLAEAALARLKPAEHLDAWGAYHLGLSHVYRFNSHDNAIASGLFKRATDLDPGFATAFAARSFTSFQNVMMGYTSDRDAAVAAARHEAERSIELDPLDPYANFAMGRLNILTGRPDDGLIWLDRSVELSPNYAKGHYSRAFIQVLCCRTDETRAGIDVAMGLSPLDPLIAPMRMMRALSFAIDGNFATAADWAMQGARTANGHLSGLMMAAALCHLGGQATQAAHWAAITREQRPDASVSLYLNALPFQSAAFRATMREALLAVGFPD